MRWRKYPHTPYLPFTKSRDPKDVKAGSVSEFAWGTGELDVVVTEKMDGENTSCYRDGLHARSLDFARHPSRDWITAYHSAYIAPLLGDDEQIMLENCYATHSLAYHLDPLYARVFGAADDTTVYSWEDVELYAQEVGLPTARVLYQGRWNTEVGVRLVKELDPEISEGFVVRTASEFPIAQFGEHVAKYVRAAHVQTDDHWLNQEMKVNR